MPQKKSAPEKKVPKKSATSKSAGTKVTKPASAKKTNKTTKTQTTTPTTLTQTFKPYKAKKGEEYMSVEQREHFKTILLARKIALMEEVDHTLDEMKTTDVPPDPSDRATQEERFNLELKTRDRERKLLKKIEKALQQIEDNEYGCCETCGEDIGIRRLEARPTAELCIECKTLAEIREKRTVL